MDCGSQHTAGCYRFEPNPNLWASQPPAVTIRDARRQLACAPKDRPGVGRAFQDANKTWHCQFGHDGREHDYTNNFVFLSVDPKAVEWKQGPDGRAVGSLLPDAPVCRANPGGGWPHMEFGWIYREGCVLGWGGRSPSIPQYETLILRP